MSVRSATHLERPARDLRVTISVGGPFPTPIRLAAYLEQHDCLERMISFMPRFRIPWAEVSDARLLRLWPLAYFGYVLRHTPVIRHRFGHTWHLAEWFDRLASRRLGECTFFNGWCMVALHSMRAARKRGAYVLLQMGSAHVEWQTQILQEEYDRFGVRWTITDQRLIDKALQEYEEADHMIVASTFVKRTLVDRGIATSRVTIVADALTRTFTPSPRSDDVFRVLYVGRLELRKGVQYLLEAFKRLKLPKAELLLVGGPQPDFARVLKQYDGVFRSVGWASEAGLADALSNASVCVIPSVEDGWCHVTQEAMSCGLPVIVSTHVGSADAVHDGVNGFVVPARHVEALMEKIELLYRNQELRADMGRAARQSIQTRTWQAYGSEMLDVFRRLYLEHDRRCNDGIAE